MDFPLLASPEKGLPAHNNAHTLPSDPHPINLPQNHRQVRVCKPLCKTGADRPNHPTPKKRAQNYRKAEEEIPMTASDYAKSSALNTHTIYLDYNPFHVRVAFLSMGIVFALQGFSGFDHHSANLPWLHRFQILVGVLSFVRAFHNIFYVRRYGRNRLFFSNEALEFKTKRHGTVSHILWQDVARINLKPNTIEITRKPADAEPLKLTLRPFPMFKSSRIDQQAKEQFKEYVSGRDVEIQF